MKKTVFIQTLIVLTFLAANPVFAQAADVTRIENFIQNVINLLVALSGVTATVFFVLGGFRYITSTGNPEQLESAKRTIVYSAIGLTIAFGAFVLSEIVQQLARNAFGTQ